MSVQSNVKQAIAMSGLLFQPHPQCDGWKTTRAVSPETVAFHNKEVEPAFDRLSVEFHEGGIEDEDGHTPPTDQYRIIPRDLGAYVDEEVFDTAEEAAERVVEIMENVVESRTG